MFKSAHELVMEAKKSVKECAAAQMKQQLPDASLLLLDVREPEEFVRGHLPGAINIPRGMLEFAISGNSALQDLARPVVVYCKTSGRAALSAVALQGMGFQNVVSIAGGFDAWQAAGYPVDKPADVSFE
ncbi:MAG TPA: rhodanese-like domain-containing protein [Rhodocyclaceae bacterium]|nr:rhodanese-like domain-containing protein [Rhodocyclaceae bacterium]